MSAERLGNGSLYPISAADEMSMHDDGWGERGITLRQHFAGLAMQALASVPVSGGDEYHVYIDWNAKQAVAYADALLAELAKAQP